MVDLHRQGMGRSGDATGRYFGPSVAGRAIILNGIDQYGDNTDTGTAVPAAQSGWRFMTRLRGLSNPADTTYVFRDTAGGVLTLRQDPAGSFGNLVAFIGPGGDSPGAGIAIPSADIIVLARSNPAGTEVSLEAWNLDGSGRVGQQNSGASAAATNFQSRSISFGAFPGGSNFLTAHCDKALFITGAGSYFGSAPDVEGTTGDILEWNWDADNGAEIVHGVDLTLHGSPTFENTP